MIDRYAVMGHPVSHSKSPKIHRLFAAQTNQRLRYDAIAVEPGHFPQAVTEFRGQGGKGLNITLPFKQEACALADRLSERARIAGAANTLVFNADGTLFADNTDGAGLLQDLRVNNKIQLGGKRLLICGAGGAVRGILQPLIEQQPAAITIANRTVSRARQLADAFSTEIPLQVSDYAGLQGDTFDLVINATSLSLENKVPPLPDGLLAEQAACYDLMYSDHQTSFCRWAESQGATLALDGLGMLVEQAAESFLLWRGVRPQTQEAIALLRNETKA